MEWEARRRPDAAHWKNATSSILSRPTRSLRRRTLPRLEVLEGRATRTPQLTQLRSA